MADPRYLLVENESNLFFTLGFVIEREAQLRHIGLDEIAAKARIGHGQMKRIVHGTQPFLQFYTLMRIADCFQLKASDIIQFAELVDIKTVIATREWADRVLYAGGTANKKNLHKPTPVGGAAQSPQPPAPTPIVRRGRRGGNK